MQVVLIDDAIEYFENIIDSRFGKASYEAAAAAALGTVRQLYKSYMLVVDDREDDETLEEIVERGCYSESEMFKDDLVNGVVPDDDYPF